MQKGIEPVRGHILGAHMPWLPQDPPSSRRLCAATRQLPCLYCLIKKHLRPKQRVHPYSKGDVRPDLPTTGRHGSQATSSL